MPFVLLPVLAVAALIVILRLIFGARLWKHIVAICIGGVVGFFFAFYEAFAGSPMHIFDIVELPVFGLERMLEHVFGIPVEKAMLCFFMFHFAYWAFIGGALFFGVAVLWARVASDGGDA